MQESEQVLTGCFGIILTVSNITVLYRRDYTKTEEDVKLKLNVKDAPLKSLYLWLVLKLHLLAI